MLLCELTYSTSKWTQTFPWYSVTVSSSFSGMFWGVWMMFLVAILFSYPDWLFISCPIDVSSSGLARKTFAWFRRSGNRWSCRSSIRLDSSLWYPGLRSVTNPDHARDRSRGRRANDRRRGLVGGCGLFSLRCLRPRIISLCGQSIPRKWQALEWLGRTLHICIFWIIVP